MARRKRPAGGARLQTFALGATLLAVAALVGSMVYGLDTSGGAAPPVALDAAGPAAEPPAGRVRVEVLNASGRSGLAERTMRRLRDQGFDVVHWGNAPRSLGDSTRVLDRVGRAGAAEEVAEALGIARVTSARDTTLAVDATVVLGRDWPADEVGGEGAGDGG